MDAHDKRAESILWDFARTRPRANADTLAEYEGLLPLLAAELRAAGVERDRIASALRTCRPLLRYPENGTHYCRACGSLISKHDAYCSYVERCRAIDAARAEADAALTPAGTSAHDRNDDPACLSCGHVATDHPQGRRCGATGEDSERCGCLQLRLPAGTEGR